MEKAFDKISFPTTKFSILFRKIAAFLLRVGASRWKLEGHHELWFPVAGLWVGTISITIMWGHIVFLFRQDFLALSMCVGGESGWNDGGSLTKKRFKGVKR